MARIKPTRFFIFILFRIFSFFVYIMPLNIALAAGKILGRLCFLLGGREKKKIFKHLDIAFGGTKSLAEKELIATEVFENLGKNLVEVISLHKFNNRNIDRYVQCPRIEVMRRMVEHGKGGIALSAHFGNWELLAHYFAIKGYSVNVIARRVRMECFERFLQKARKQHGVNVLYRDASAKDVIDILKNNEVVGIMPDQDMDSVSGVFVDFFGKKAYTPNGPAILNRLTGSPIIPCFILRKGFGHEIVIDNPIEMVLTCDKDNDIKENTQRYTKVIENYIRDFPSQWVWFHERWKTSE